MEVLTQAWDHLTTTLTRIEQRTEALPEFLKITLTIIGLGCIWGSVAGLLVVISV